MSDKKKIIIGDILTEDQSFRLASNKTQRSRKSNKDIQFKSPKEKTKTINKRNIMLRIRDIQNKNYQDLINSKTNSKKMEIPEPITKEEIELAKDFNNSFEESVKYMKALSEKEAKPTTSTTTQNHFNHTLRSHSQSPSNESWIYTNEKMEPFLNMECSQSIQPTTHSSIHLEPPKWGCMKGGTLPTYRNWVRSTQKNPTHVSEIPRQNQNLQTPLVQLNQNNASLPSAISTPVTPLIQPPVQPPTIMPKPSIPSIIQPLTDTFGGNAGPNKRDMMKNEERMRLGQTMDLMKKIPPKRHHPKQKKTIRRTFKVGKSKNKPLVGVLISNKTMRSNISTKKQLLNQTSIDDVKRYLVKHGFIRVGSSAPNDVLRKMYETSMMMCGEIHNHNPDNLLYNFLKGT